MKKAVLLAILLVLLIPSPAPALGLVVGVKGGAGTCSYFGLEYWSDLADREMANALKLGYAGGVFCTLELSPLFALQPELLIVRSGNAESEEAIFWGPYEGEVRHVDVLTYLSIPMLLKLRLMNTVLYVGSEARFRVGNGTARLKADDEALQDMFESMDLDSMLYASDVFSPLIFTAVVGLEFLLPTEFVNGEWAIESRVQYSLTNIYGEGQGSDYRVFEAALMVSYGYRILGDRVRRSRIR